jgi:protein-L-isoaspartate(D-aspartate) O-methyltransferase
MSFDFAAARAAMVESQVRVSDVTDVAIQDAMRVVPRETLCPADWRQLAYADVEIPLKGGLYLMRPREVAKLLQALRPRAGERALAIAAPYAAAVLQAIGLQVEWLDKGDLRKAPKTPGGGGYDVIVCEGAVPVAPPAWLAALAEGGRLAVVERSGPMGQAKLYLKSGGGVGVREVFDAAPPMLPGFEPAPQFAF